MNKLVLATILFSTGCLADPGHEPVSTARAAIDRPTFGLKLARVADDSLVCEKGMWLSSVCASECSDAGGTSCSKVCCVPIENTKTAGNDIAFVETDYAGIIGPEIAGIIGPEIAGIIGPELPALASFTARATSFRVKVLDGNGKTLIAKTIKGDKRTFASDLETIRAIVRDKALVDPQSVRVYLAY
jgi:hypothetical protein